MVFGTAFSIRENSRVSKMCGIFSRGVCDKLLTWLGDAHIGHLWSQRYCGITTTRLL
jgi:hypothetical protein